MYACSGGYHRGRASALLTGLDDVGATANVDHVDRKAVCWPDPWWMVVVAVVVVVAFVVVVVVERTAWDHWRTQHRACHYHLDHRTGQSRYMTYHYRQHHPAQSQYMAYHYRCYHAC